MEPFARVKLLSGAALVSALLAIYLATLHIDGLAREKYLIKRTYYAVVLLIL